MLVPNINPQLCVFTVPITSGATPSSTSVTADRLKQYIRMLKITTSPKKTASASFERRRTQTSGAMTKISRKINRSTVCWKVLEERWESSSICHIIFMLMTTLHDV